MQAGQRQHVAAPTYIVFRLEGSIDSLRIVLFLSISLPERVGS